MLPTEFIVEPDVVLLDLPGGSGEEAIRALHGRLAAESEAVADAPRFLDELLERTRIAPVCIAEDIALPHARTDAVRRLVLGVARTQGGFAFDAGHPRVQLVFLIGTPKSAVTEYLRVVAALTRLLRPASARTALMAAADEAEFRALLSGGVAAQR